MLNAPEAAARLADGNSSSCLPIPSTQHQGILYDILIFRHYIIAPQGAINVRLYGKNLTFCQYEYGTYLAYKVQSGTCNRLKYCTVTKDEANSVGICTFSCPCVGNSCQLAVLAVPPSTSDNNYITICELDIV